MLTAWSFVTILLEVNYTMFYTEYIGSQPGSFEEIWQYKFNSSKVNTEI